MKFKVIIVSLLLLVQSIAWAELDLSSYDLTEAEIATIRRLEKRGIAEKTLLGFAAALVREKTKIPAFIPPHTLDDLFALNAWASGGAFAQFAKQANVEFDRKAYLDDCPQPRLFRYAMATASAGLQIDVMTQYYSAVYSLERAMTKDPQNFQNAYLELIKGTAFEKYVVPTALSLSETNR